MSTRRIGLGSVVLLVLAAGCTSLPGVPTGSPSSTPSAAESVGRETGAPSASASIATGDLLRGTLGFEDIEGGCPYLAVNGVRYQVQYPDGYRIDPANGDLIGPDEAVIASLGDGVEVRGAPLNDVGTICQIGPVFGATEVMR